MIIYDDTESMMVWNNIFKIKQGQNGLNDKYILIFDHLCLEKNVLNMPFAQKLF